MKNENNIRKKFLAINYIIFNFASILTLLVTSGVYGGLRLLPQIFVQKPDFKLSENSDTKADFRNPPYTMLPPVRARNIIPGRLSDHEMPEPVVLLSEKARISNAELITKTDFGPAEGSMGVNVLGLCDGGAIEAQIFNFSQKLNKRNSVELCNFAPLLQNPC
ncbi:hypothetical protein [Kaistella pullorum]|uniref:hypothetical protein n=1 Tax=Kaistella pullorum TaxID=2763074 RepID=UPI002044E6F3|nr:hypothetical protein [Kaistella pullorum]